MRNSERLNTRRHIVMQNQVYGCVKVCLEWKAQI